MEYLIVILLLYFLPALVAPSGRRGSIFILNLLVGWTMIGWAVALFMAVRAHEDVRKAAPHG